MITPYIFSIVWRPIFDTSWVWLLLSLAAFAAGFAYSRVFETYKYKSLWLLILRLLSIAILAVILFGPSELLESESANRKGSLSVLADVSESMLTEDKSGRTRLQDVQEKWLSNDVLRRLDEEYDVQLFQFAEKPRRVGSATNGDNFRVAEGQDTFLVRSTTKVLSQMGRSKGKSQALLILSDGIDSENATVNRVGEMATAKGIGVHTAVFGSDSVTRDMAVVAAAKQDYLFPNESGSIVAKIYQVGFDAGRTILNVKQGADKQSIPIDFKNRGVVEVEIPVQHEQPGQYEYELSIKTLTGETEVANNVQSAFAKVQPRRMQVLLIEGAPFWDTKFIAQSLRQDERIELTQISQVNPRKRVTIVTRGDEKGGSVAAPKTKDDWSKYDVVIFGREIENLITAASAKELVDLYESSGINIVCSRGRPYGLDGPGRNVGVTLSAIEPVEWSGKTFSKCGIKLTVPGQITRWFAPTKMGLDVETALERLSGFSSGDVVKRPKTNARILAETVEGQGAGKPQPALVTATNGYGSFVTIAGEGFWRWSLLSDENQDLAGFYDTFWSNMVRWLVIGGDFEPGKKISLKLSKSSIRIGEELTVDVALKQAATGADPKLMVKYPDGKSKQVALTPVAGRSPRYQAKITATQDGVHTIQLDAPGILEDELSQKFSAYQLNVEKLNTTANPINLKLIADQSEGNFYKSDECEKFLKQVKLDAVAAKIPPKTVYVWDQAWLMTLLLILVGSEWILRKYTGLI